MLLCHLEGLIYTFTNGDTRNNNDELAPAILLIQFIHCLNICVGLTNTRLHFNGQIEFSFQLMRRCNLIISLYFI